MDNHQVQALVFDVFGTVVDWRGSVMREAQALGAARGIAADWAAFADAWRAGYRPAMDRVNRGDLPWTPLDDLHRMILDTLIQPFGLQRFTEADLAHLNQAWRRLTPWPDAVEGLRAVKERYIIAALSNGNMRLMVDLARHAGLPWDCVLGAEVVRRYKPDPKVYLAAMEMLRMEPAQVMMVAAHESDLRAAKALGMATAFVRRPLEFGPAGIPDEGVDPAIDLAAGNLVDLAHKLASQEGV